MSAPPSVRVVVKLPWNRPENAPADPPQIEWTPEKADILWKVIERSRSTESEGADWKGLAAHLEVPLPYILYRVHARFQEELRGLQDIQGTLNPSTVQPLAVKSPEELANKERPTIFTGRSGSTISQLTSSSRLPTPLNVRARLNSLVNNTPRSKKATSSSTLTVQGVKRQHIPLQPTSPSSEEPDSEEDDAEKEDEADRQAEQQEALDRKLQELQKMMTNETLGLVRSSRPKGKGRMPPSRSMTGSYPRDGFSSQSLSSRSVSQSVSSASSPRGSIPEIPGSPNAESQPHSPLRRHMSPVKSSSPPVVSARSALSHAHRQYGPLVDRSSEPGSSHESDSFSDLSDSSLSASALESVVSNTRGASSGFAHFRSRLPGR